MCQAAMNIILTKLLCKGHMRLAFCDSRIWQSARQLTVWQSNTDTVPGVLKQSNSLCRQSTSQQTETSTRCISQSKNSLQRSETGPTTRLDEAVSDRFVPTCDTASEEDILRVQEFVQCSKRLFVLTGAGLSTESGIPDYRSEGVGLYARSKNRPVQYQDFVKYPEIRQRYWARNYVGWPTFGFFSPNASHDTLYDWEDAGKVHWLVTQNVDALHFKAGSTRVTELHGSAHRVMCLGCSHVMTRPEMQKLIESHNAGWFAHSDEMAPDADVYLTQEQIAGFTVPPCPRCSGPLKPQITFFGDNVAKRTVEFVHERVRESDSMLLAGTSVQVYSGYRFAMAAHEQGKPIAIVNIGPTRADKLADLIVSARCGDVLPKIKL